MIDINLFRNNFGNAINFGGDGRYFYRIDPTTNASTIDVVDSTLCTSGNYLGSGSWTSNPIIASISLAAGKTYRAMAYNPDREEIAVLSTDATRIAIIDAKPSSGTFNTLLSTLTTTLSGSVGQAIIYNPFKKYFFIGYGGALTTYSTVQNKVIADFPLTNNQHMWFYMNPHTGDFISGNTNSYILIIRDIGKVGNPVFKCIGGGPNNPMLPFFSLKENRIFFGTPRSTAANLNAMVYPNFLDTLNNDYTSLSTIVASAAMRFMSGNPVSTKQNKLFYSTNGLVTGFVNITNPRAIASITTHTRTAISSETTAARYCLNGNEDVLAIEPMGGTPQHMHVYDAVNNSYVGYVSFGKTGVNDQTYTSPLICNRWLN
ncbi:MAG TPA: hypothetical protein PLN38_16935 [Chitinophagales bacterium]|nr:hypothetical protein [Chitinophagales bacterium]